MAGERQVMQGCGWCFEAAREGARQTGWAAVKESAEGGNASS